MKNTAIVLATLLLAACVTVPTSSVYRQAPGNVASIIYVLPVEDSVGGSVVSADARQRFRVKLVRSLEETGVFAAIREAESAASPENGSTYIRCRISQFDTAARRMVVISEFVNSESRDSFLKLVTHTELVSLAWPIDYIAVMERASDAIASDISTQIAALKKT